MGYPLYGNDMDEDTTPIEAGLGWVISKTNESYIGSDIIEKQRAEGALIKRVGIKLNSKAVARNDVDIFHGGKKVGIVTSGAFSPRLKQSIAIASIDKTLAKVGQEVEVEIRGKRHQAEIVKMPFLNPQTKTANAA
jgi:aminomethyltransferase